MAAPDIEPFVAPEQQEAQSNHNLRGVIKGSVVVAALTATAAFGAGKTSPTEAEQYTESRFSLSPAIVTYLELPPPKSSIVEIVKQPVTVITPIIEPDTTIFQPHTRDRFAAEIAFGQIEAARQAKETAETEAARQAIGLAMAEQALAPPQPSQAEVDPVILTINTKLSSAQAWRLAHAKQFLECTISFESATSGVYLAVSPDHRHFGAYQFDQPTWDTSVREAGYPEYVGIRPDQAKPAVQDVAATWLYTMYGNAPWEGRC